MNHMYGRKHMRAQCNHRPRLLVPTSARHKDGTNVMVCADCKTEWSRRYHRKKTGFYEWWDRQHGLCALCGQPLVEDKTTHLDHNHTTGQKRGLVHARCNHMIGGVEATIALVGLDRLLAYLRSDPTPQDPRGSATSR